MARSVLLLLAEERQRPVIDGEAEVCWEPIVNCSIHFGTAFLTVHTRAREKEREKERERERERVRGFTKWGSMLWAI